MCSFKNNSSSKDEENDSDTDSDSSMSDSDLSENEISSDSHNDETLETIDDNTELRNEVEDEEEEDEVIKAIRREAEKKSNHPPTIHCEDFPTNIAFHPQENILAVATIVGDVIIYKYTNEENTVVNNLEVHTKSCRDLEFTNDGQKLFTTSKDKAIMISDCQTGKLLKFYEEAHDVPIYCLRIIDENLFASGDDDGMIKLWDIRQSGQIYKAKRNEDYISAIGSDEANKYLLCTSGDGSLTTFDLTNRKFFMQSEEYDEELTCLGLFRTETKLVTGTTKGKLLLFNWNEFGLHSDEVSGPKSAINSLIPITENIVVTACEDGILRATHLFPHRHLGIVGQHELSVERIDISNDGELLASCSHNNDIKFWNIKYFEDFEKISRKHKKSDKKKDMMNNLPSSKVRNVSDFFSDLKDES